jgi:hypothetical protein
LARLEDLTRGASVRGVLPHDAVTVVDIRWHGSNVVELTYKDAPGRLGSELLYRDREPTRHNRFARTGVISEQEAQRLAGQHVAIDGCDLMGQRFDQGGVDREHRVEQVGEANPISLGDQPEQGAIALEAPDAARVHDVEGINLQRAHLTVNYDLPWNPNPLEQRFGRIHRIGQNEVCHMWNLVAEETREGEVFTRILEKLEQERIALGGQVFDVMGKISFEGRPLRELMIEAIRYGERPEVRERLTRMVDEALDRDHLRDLIEERALAHDSMDAARVHEIREEMERAEARRLQPHFIASFFMEAFRLLGGTLREREPRRYEITHVPAAVRNRDRTCLLILRMKYV